MAHLGTTKGAANLDVGAGEFSFCNFDLSINPNQTFHTLGNCSEATLSWEVNKISKRDATRGTREKIAEVETQRDATLNITMDESDPIKYALAMYGKHAIKEIDAQHITKTYKVSPGEEIFITIGDTQTPAYNYKDLQIRLLSSTSASVTGATLDTQASALMEAGGTITAAGAYTGQTDADYYIRISGGFSDVPGTQANETTGTITDVKFQWMKGLAGVWSTDTLVTGNAQTIDAGVTVTFAPDAADTLDFVVGDVYKITCDAAMSTLREGIDYIADSVDVTNGKVRFPLTADFDSDTTVIVECDIEKQVIPRVYAGIYKKLEGMLRFEYDPTWGRQKAFVFYHVVIAPNGDDSLINEDWTGRQITAAVLASDEHADPENPDSRYYRIDYPIGSKDVLTR